MTNPIKFLGISLAIALAVLVYKINVKREQELLKPNPLYEKTFKTAIAVTRAEKGIIIVFGTCISVNIDFKYYTDSVVFKLNNNQSVVFRVLGVDDKNGLHTIRRDSTEVIFYKGDDPRYGRQADGRDCVMMIDKANRLAFLFSQDTKCE